MYQRQRILIFLIRGVGPRVFEAPIATHRIEAVIPVLVERIGGLIESPAARAAQAISIFAEREHPRAFVRVPFRLIHGDRGNESAFVVVLVFGDVSRRPPVQAFQRNAELLRGF